MKYLVLFFLCFSFSAFSQDVIIKKDGKKIEAKVVEITTTTIKYRSWDQQDGPLRNVLIKDVKEVIYNDGSWDSFEDKKVEEETKIEEDPVDLDIPDSRNDPILKNGLFIDIMPGVGIGNLRNQQPFYVFDQATGTEIVTQTVQTTTDIYGTLALRLGNKWYFGTSDRWRPGVEAAWLRFTMYINDEIPESIIIGPKSIAPVNVGMTNVFKFSEGIGLEANLTGGLHMELDLDEGELLAGVALTPEVKFRLKKLAIGLDYMRVFGINDSSSSTPYQSRRDWDVFSLSVGFKF